VTTRHGPAPAATATPGVPLAVRLAIVIVAGLGVGVATSFLQAHLGSPWLALVNSASPWLVPAFAVGALERDRAPAAAAGLAACVLEVAGYFATSRLRGFSGGLSFELFWTGCALAGGPLFGLAGWLWRTGPARLRGLGAAALPAAFAAEGLIAYAVRLHYTSSAVLFVILGAVAALALGWPGRRWPGLARWFLPALAAGILAELLVGLLYQA
jgi:hypothetical protein